MLVYTFPGMTGFLDAAADRLGCGAYDRRQAERAWHVQQVQTLLCQVPPAPPESRAGTLRAAAAVRDSLACALAACDAAIAEVSARFGPEPAPADRVAPRLARRP